MNYPKDFPWEFHNDLGGLSSISALEISDLINNRDVFSTEPIKRFNSKLDEGLNKYLDRTLIVILNTTLRRLASKGILLYPIVPETVEAVQRIGNNIIHRLEKIYENPKYIQKQDVEELEVMREFLRTFYLVNQSYEPLVEPPI